MLYIHCLSNVHSALIFQWDCLYILLIFLQMLLNIHCIKWLHDNFQILFSWYKSSPTNTPTFSSMVGITDCIVSMGIWRNLIKDGLGHGTDATNITLFCRPGKQLHYWHNNYGIKTNGRWGNSTSLSLFAYPANHKLHICTTDIRCMLHSETSWSFWWQTEKMLCHPWYWIWMRQWYNKGLGVVLWRKQE